MVACKILEYITASTETQLILSVDDMAKQLDGDKIADISILDFTKAFDNVPHKRLIKEICFYGLSGQIANCLQDFLTGRSQQVVVDRKFSNQAPVLSRVPQGTVLGPIAFLFYVSDLSTNSSSQVRLFADDCLMYTATAEVDLFKSLVVLWFRDG